MDRNFSKLFEHLELRIEKWKTRRQHDSKSKVKRSIGEPSASWLYIIKNSCITRSLDLRYVDVKYIEEEQQSNLVNGAMVPG